MEVPQTTSYKDGSQKTQHEKWKYIIEDYHTTWSLNDLIVYNDTAKDYVKQWIIIIIIIYSSIALISSSVRTCSVRCLEIACVQEHENNIHNSNRHNKTMIINTET